MALFVVFLLLPLLFLLLVMMTAIEVFETIGSKSQAVKNRLLVQVFQESCGSRDFHYSSHDWEATEKKATGAGGEGIIITTKTCSTNMNKVSYLCTMLSFLILSRLLWWLDAGWLHPPGRCVTCVQQQPDGTGVIFPGLKWDRSGNPLLCHPIVSKHLVDFAGWKVACLLIKIVGWKGSLWVSFAALSSLAGHANVCSRSWNRLLTSELTLLVLVTTLQTL